MESEDKLKGLFERIKSDPKMGIAYKDATYDKFREFVVSDNSFRKDLFLDLKEFGIIDPSRDFSTFNKNLEQNFLAPVQGQPQPNPLQASREKARPIGVLAPQQQPTIDQVTTRQIIGDKPVGVLAPQPQGTIDEVTSEQVVTPIEQKPEPSLGQKIMKGASDLASGFNRAVFKAPSAIAKTAAELGAGVRNIFGDNVKAEEDYAYRLADKYDDFIDNSWVGKNLIGDKDVNSLAGDVGSGLGQIATMVMSGGGSAAQGLKQTPTVLKELGKRVFSRPTAVAFTQVFDGEYQNMKEKGESDKVAFEQALLNATAMAPLENLPLANLMERATKIVGAPLAKRVLNALVQGTEEGAQEVVQQLFSNLTNNQLVELEKNIVDLSEGIERSGEAGGIVGTLLGALVGVKAGRLPKGKQPPAQLGGIPTQPAMQPRQKTNPDGSITITVGSLEEVPEQYRDKARKGFTGTATTLPFGLGKKTNIEQYSYDVTPEEAAYLGAEEVEYEPVSETEPETPIAEPTPITEPVTQDEVDFYLANQEVPAAMIEQVNADVQKILVGEMSIDDIADEKYKFIVAGELSNRESNQQDLSVSGSEERVQPVNPQQPAEVVEASGVSEDGDLEVVITNETPKEQVIASIQTLPITRVEGLGMGQSQAEGTYYSTEPVNRYATPENPAVPAKVDVKNPYVSTEDFGLVGLRNQLLNENRVQFEPPDFENFDMPDGEITIEDLSEEGIAKLSSLVTKTLQDQGYDSIYFPASDIQEGELVVFKNKKQNEQVSTTRTEVRKTKNPSKNEGALRKKGKATRNAGATPDAIAARNVEFFGNPLATSLQYTMDITYHPDLLQRIFGGPDPNKDSGRKSIAGEQRSRIGFLDKKSPIKTADRLGELLAEKYAEDNNIDVREAEERHDFTSIAEEIIMNYPTRASMVKEILNINENLEFESEREYDLEEIYGPDYNEDIANEVEEALENLPDSYWEGKQLTDKEYAELFAPEEIEPAKSPEEIQAEQIVSDAKQKVADAESALRQANKEAGQTMNIPLQEKTALGLTVEIGSPDARRKVKEAETALELAKRELQKAQSQAERLRGKPSNQLGIDTAPKQQKKPAPVKTEAGKAETSTSAETRIEGEGKESPTELKVPNPKTATVDEVLIYRLNVAQQEIEQDIADGAVPVDASSFEDLDANVDANMYVNDAERPDNVFGQIGRREKWGMEGFITHTNRMTNAIDAWLRSGRKGSVADYLPKAPDAAKTKDEEKERGGLIIEVKSNKDVSKVFKRLMKNEHEEDDYDIHGLLADWDNVEYNPDSDKLIFEETRSGTGNQVRSKKGFINDILNGNLEKEVPSAKEFIQKVKESILEEMGVSAPPLQSESLQDNAASPFSAFEPGKTAEEKEAKRKARAELKEKVGKDKFKVMETVNKDAEKILRDLEGKGKVRIDCP